MTEPLDWDEFRLVRAIAGARSLTGAAESLGLNHSTLFRRLAALEAHLGLKLFDRERSGYRPTAAGEDMVALAALMGETIEEFERRIAGNEVKPSGRVRLTTPDALGELVLPELAAALIGRHPGLHVELILTDSSLDLERGEADLALRRLKSAPTPCLTGRRVAPLRWGLYAAAPLDEGEDAGKGPWVVQSESFAPVHVREWLDRNVELWRRMATANTDVAVAGLASRAVGAALLPCYVARHWPQLKRIGDADPDIDDDLWLLATERSLRKPRVRAAFDFLADALERRSDWFDGGAAVGA